MGSTDKFCLRWNDFESNISTSFRDLRLNQDFFDVSLAVEQDQVVQAHKVILAACSPFFRNVLAKQIMSMPYGHPHPVIYLRGIKIRDLRHVLDFMYHGEVNVAQEDLNSFLAVAEDLQIKGLTQDDNLSSAKQSPVRHKSDSKKRGDPPDRGENGPPTKKRVSNIPSPGSREDDENLRVVSPPVKQEALGDIEVSYGDGPDEFPDAGEDDFGQFEIGQRYDEPQPGASDGLKDCPTLARIIEENTDDTGQNSTLCLLCRVTLKRNSVRAHFRDRHYSTIRYRCPECNGVYANRNSFKVHISKKHRNLRGLNYSEHAC